MEARSTGCTQASALPAQVDRSHPRRPRQCGSLQFLCGSGYHCRTLLVAFHGTGYCVVCQDLSHMPDLTDPPSPDPTCGCNPGTPLHKNVHGHYAPPMLRWLGLHHARPMLANWIPRISDAMERDCPRPRGLDIPRCPLLMGYTNRNHIQQQKALCSSTQVPQVQVSH
jgi:hypothetical protein